MTTQDILKALLFGDSKISKFTLDDFDKRCWSGTGADLLYIRYDLLAVKLAILADARGTYYAVKKIQQDINNLTGIDIEVTGVYTPELIRVVDILSAQDDRFLVRLREVL